LPSIVDAHDIYLQMLGSGGLILTMAMMCYFGMCLRTGWKCQGLGNGVGLALFVSVSVWLVIGVVENQIIDRYLYFPVGLVAALSRAAARSSEPGAEGRKAADLPYGPNFVRGDKAAAGVP